MVMVSTPPSPMVHVYQDTFAPQRPVSFLIAFKNNTIRLAVAYWLKGKTLFYVTADHQQRSVPVDSVDYPLSERLNAEQHVNFTLASFPPKTELRLILKDQLNLILETRDTPRGLVVGISDVLFDFGKATLTPGAREKLARIAGILAAYSGLSPHLEGYTDNVGSKDYNVELSRRRAEAVRTYLLSQGVPASNMTAAGLGEVNPVASNATAAGRQRNRRVEMVISGDVIGIAVASTPTE